MRSNIRKMRKYIHLAQPLFDKNEEREIVETLRSGWVTLGPRTKDFEEKFAKYVGSKYAVAVTSCTAALHLSLLAAGIGPGDEVVTTIFTFAASANVIINVGAKPVFADIDPKTFNINPKKIEEKITSKTKAIMPMHYGGQPADMDSIIKIARKNNLVVIEDAATAIGAEYKGIKIGNIGDLSCFSFHPIKNMSTGDGGMITTNNKKYAEMLSLLRAHGMSKEAWKRHTASGSWKYDILFPGYKYHMTDIQSALGLHQLRKLDDFIKTRKTYASIYDKAFLKIKEITIPYVSRDVLHARNLYTILIDTKKIKITRDKLVDKLKKLQIGASVYYIPLYEFSYYKKNHQLRKENFPVADEIYRHMISLPLYPGMTKDDVDYIANAVRILIEKNRK